MAGDEEALLQKMASEHPVGNIVCAMLEWIGLLLFLFGQPAVLIVELIAQTIQEWINAVVDEASFRERQRWRTHQGVSDCCGQSRKIDVRFRQVIQPFRGVIDTSFQLGGESGETFQAVSDSHQIAGTGVSRSGSAGQTLQIPHGSKQFS